MSHNKNLLSVPRTGFNTRGGRAFQALVPKLWSALPLALGSSVVFLWSSLKRSYSDRHLVQTGSKQLLHVSYGTLPQN